VNGGERAAETPSSDPGTSETSRRLQHDHERQLAAVVADLWEHSETLIRQELALVKAEYEARAIHAKAALQHSAISIGLFHAAYLTTLAMLLLLLAKWLDPSLAALILAIGASAGAFVFTRLGKQALNEAIKPSQQNPSHHPVLRQRVRP
jgi:hypothetical protein